MTGASPSVTCDEAFVAQCEADYTTAEITGLAHFAPEKSSPPTLLLAVVELLHGHLEPNPLVCIAPERGGYPRRANWRTTHDSPARSSQNFP